MPQARASTNQTLATASSWTQVTLSVDDVPNYPGTQMSATSRFVPTLAGWFRFSGAVLWNAGQSTASPGIGARVVKNGSNVPGTSASGSYAGVIETLVIPTLAVYLTPSDYLELQAISALAGRQLLGAATEGSVLSVWNSYT